MWSALTAEPAAAWNDAALHEFKAWVRRAWWADRRTPRQKLRGVYELASTPWRFWKEAVRVYRAHAPFVSRHFAVPAHRQILGLLHARVQYGLDPIAYYRFQLFRPERWARAGMYVQTADTGRVLRWLVARTPGYVRVFGDKRAFEQWCAEQNFPSVRTLMEFERGRLSRTTVQDGRLPGADLFSKPSNSQGGDDTERWTWREDGSYVASDGRVRDAEGLTRELAALSSTLGRPMLLQVALCNAAPEMSLTPGGLCTARITTIRLPDEPPLLFSGIYRMPADRATAADNFAAGGLASPIDVRSGRLGPAVRKDLSLLDAPAVVHPQTGAPIQGHTLTHWPEAVGLVLRAHAAVTCRGVPVIGWDVALTERGPVLVEGNNIPCSTLGQMALDAPLGDSPLLACINAHLRERFIAHRGTA